MRVKTSQSQLRRAVIRREFYQSRAGGGQIHQDELASGTGWESSVHLPLHIAVVVDFRAAERHAGFG